MKRQFCLILILICGVTTLNSAQFKNFTVDDGLSSNHVYCIHQDSLGFMWFGTTRGLNRWDGIEFLVFRHDPADSNSLSFDEVKVILQNNARFLWIGTKHGLNRFNLETETITRYFFYDAPFASNFIYDIIAQDDSIMWVATAQGLVRFNYQNVSHQRIIDFDDKGERVPGLNYINSICLLDNGKIVIGRTFGFILFDPLTRTFHEIHEKLAAKNWGSGFCAYKDREGLVWLTFSHGDVFQWNPHDDSLFHISHKYPFQGTTFRVLQTRDNRIWITTLDNGLFSFNKATGHREHYLPKAREQGRLSSTMAAGLFEDRQGNLWIGTYDGGVNVLPRQHQAIYLHRPYPDPEKSIGDGEVYSLCEDLDGYLWVASLGGGIARISPDFQSAFNYSLDETHQLDNRWSRVIECDREGNLWFGGSVSARLDWKRHTSTYIQALNSKRIGYRNDAIQAICQDSLGNMWFGGMGSGLKCLTPTQQFFEYTHDPQDSTSLPHTRVLEVICDHTGCLWIGSSRGLSALQPGENHFKNYHIPSLPIYAIKSMIEDHTGLFWLCASHGLYTFDRFTEKFTDWNPYVELGFSHILDIVQADNRDLWIRTTEDLIQFNPETKWIRHYDHTDGFIGINTSNWAINAFHKGGSGYIYYGGTRIVGKFHPDSVIDKQRLPIVLSDLRVNYERVRPGENSILPKSLPYLDELVLPYTANSFSIEFVRPGFSSNVTKPLTFQLQGFDDRWTPADDYHEAIFTNLPPGDYVFRVKEADETVTPPLETSLLIHILPPWWRTTWAWFLWISLFVGAIYAVYRLQLNRTRLQQKYQLEREHAQKLAQFDQLKSNFFANVSHEFRTPLTLILGPLEEINQKIRNEWLKKQCRVMLNNGRRLLLLVNQLLDFSAVEAGGLKLRVSETDLVAFVKRVVASFMSLAERKKISLKFTANERFIPVFIDPEQFEKVMVNLLSNAFKFTPAKGRIDVLIDRTSEQNSTEAVDIKVRDNGLGIPKEHLDHVFDRFFQVSGEWSKQSIGMGIGLALSKELVELHGGQISAESEPGVGSLFIVRIPLGCTHFKNVEIIEDQVTESFFEPVEEDDVSEIPSDDSINDRRKPSVLIVEDNKEVRQYLRDILTPDFRTKEAVDGEQGFEKSIDLMPDLILSDVMMPVVDGFELSERLKKDDRTSHIPIILLTARASDASKIEGLELGVDDYIIKPFNARELKVRVKNLILQRKKLREKFCRHWMTVSLPEISMPLDECFLQRALELIEAHLEDPEFNAQTFAEQIGLSRMQLHRKLKALTNMATSEFIITVRLKHAAELLKRRVDSVSQIAFQVGFNNPSYFAECFKKLYGVPPSQYASIDLH